MSTHADTGRAACIDHGIIGCEDCGHWQDAADEREEAHELQIAALKADLAAMTRVAEVLARPDNAARRRVLAKIATECPGQDVAGVFVIDDALRIDFVSGDAILFGADGTLSWEAAR